MRTIERSKAVMLNIVLIILSALLLAYLVYALLRPEKF
jgi:K+-transporting ATPase KdpF subunit